MKKLGTILLRVGISAILILFLFRQVDKKSLFEIIRHADKPLLLLAFSIFFSNHILALFRWEMLLKAVKIHLPLKRIVMSFAGGIFFNLFMPSTIGGDLMRSIDLAAYTSKPKEVITTVFLDRLSGYIGLVSLSVLSLAFGWKIVEDKSVLLAVSVITGILIIMLLVLFNHAIYQRLNRLLHSPNAGKIRELIKNLHEEIHFFRKHKKTIAANLIFSLLIQVVSPLCFYVIALSLGIKIGIIYFLIFIPIISAITLLPISIGGLGLRDATTIFFFAKAGVGKDLAFAMSLLSFSFLIICGSLGGLIYVLTIHHRRLQRHQPPRLHP